MRKSLVLLLLLAPITAHSQSPITIAPSECVWHAGDNPAWAAPVLNESGWKPLSSWRIAAYQPRMWMRCHANLSELQKATHPALQVSQDGAYELYLNGTRVGQNGNLRSGHYSLDLMRTFPVSPGKMAAGSNTVALRLVNRPGGGTPPEIAAGETGWLRDRRNSEALASAEGFLPQAIGFGVIGVMGFVLLGLYLNDRSRLELLLLAVVCWWLAMLRLSDFCLLAWVPLPDQVYWAIYTVGQTVEVPMVWFVFRIARRRVPMVFKILLVVSGTYAFVCFSIAFFPVRGNLWVTAFYTKWMVVVLLDLAILATASFVAFWPWNRIPRDQRAVAGCAMLWGLIGVAWFCSDIWRSFAPASNDLYTRWESVLLDLRAFGTITVIIALIGLLFREQRRTAQERAVLAGEMQAAQAIQRMLVPTTVQTVPGITLEVAFQPMREVGGDFYQCRILPDGTQRILLGDVSGKGAAAAMTATLLIGATKGRPGDSPSALLQHLNRALQESEIAGFVTCLCAHIAPNGTLTVANAGHLAPYRNGEEIALDPALPLGIAAETTYSESIIQLAAGDTLTLLSDGVVEAQSATGELFGFDRTREVSRQSAEEIARVAQSFGQQDDITVLTLQFAPAEALHA